MPDPFDPYIKRLTFGLSRPFFYATEQAQKWYDPVPQSWIVELEWIREHVDLGKGRAFLDGGCHHGLYGVALVDQCDYFAVDLHSSNVDITRVNCALNNIPATLGNFALANDRGWVRCFDNPLGALDDAGDSTVLALRLWDVCPKANVVKLDVEGAEWMIFPDALDKMPSVDTWIVEIHPWWGIDQESGLPIKDLFTPFLDHGFDLGWVDRSQGDQAEVRALENDDAFVMQSTLFAIRK